MPTKVGSIFTDEYLMSRPYARVLMTEPSLHKPHLTIVVAMACEAKPIVDYLRLRKRSDTVFAHYVDADDARTDTVTNLVVSGIGALNMAAAVAWMGAQLTPQQLTPAQRPAVNSVWLNVGIAGHQKFEVGNCLRVVGCMDAISERRFHPPLVAKWRGQNTELISYNAPTDDYPQNLAVDMEASAFFATAAKFCSLELVQSLKVVSDNPESPAERLNASMISQLIQPHVSRILEYGGALLSLLPPLVTPLKLPRTVLGLHCTKSQELQLIELCRKLQSIGFDNDSLAREVEGLSSIKQVLRQLESIQLDTAPELRGQVSDCASSSPTKSSPTKSSPLDELEE